MDNQLESLSIAEIDNISEAIMKLVGIYPNLPEKIPLCWQDLEKGESVGVFSMQGAVYLSKDILGGFRAQFPFRICYRSISDGNSDRIDSQKILEELSCWLESLKFMSMKDGRIIEKIERRSPVFQVAKDENGDVFQSNMNLIYRKED